MQKFTKKPLVLVEWDDISGYPSWADESECSNDDIVKCQTIGWKIKNNSKKFITIASTRSHHGRFCDRTTLPKQVVTKITRLER